MIALIALTLLAGPDLSALAATFHRIVRTARADVGVALIHVESGALVSVHGDRRYPMASVYKLPIAVELLTQISQGTVTFDRPITLGPSDMRACRTLSRKHPHGGVTLTVADLLELMIVESDNTSADAVLKLVGGPTVVERRLRALGFPAINVNRFEGDMNLEMVGVVNPPPQEAWTLDLQRQLVAAVEPEPLRAPGRDTRATRATPPRPTTWRAFSRVFTSAICCRGRTPTCSSA